MYHISLLCVHFLLRRYLFVSEVVFPFLQRVMSKPPVQRPLQLMASQVQQMFKQPLKPLFLNYLFHSVLKLLLPLRHTWSQQRNADAGNVNQNLALPEPPLEERQGFSFSCLPSFLPLLIFCAFCGLFCMSLVRRHSCA